METHGIKACPIKRKYESLMLNIYKLLLLKTTLKTDYGNN